MADFIVDGIHLDAGFLEEVALRAKGLDRSVLVTDAASSGRGSAPGRYRLGEQDVDHTADGRVVLAGTDRLAGSALRMDRGVDDLMRLCGLRLADADPDGDSECREGGRRLRRAGGAGCEPGDRADFAQFRLTPQVEVVETRVSGRKVF